MYALRDVSGKGKGLVAVETISKGTRILAEQPIVTVLRNEPDSEQLRRSVCQQVDALGEHQRSVFLSMHNLHPYRTAAEQNLGIVRTNALPIGTNGSEGGIFLEACRVNHACDNNAQKNWNTNIKQHTVHSLRDIHKGEEITIYYLGVHQNREARNQALQAKFGFTCSCHLCSLPLEQSQESDRRLDEIYRLDGLIGRGGVAGITNHPLRFLRYVDEQVRLYNEQGPDDASLSRAFLDAAQIAIANGDLARGRIFAERAVSGWSMALGGDSMEVIEHGNLARDPSKHDLYGISMNWRTAVEESPCGLEPSDLEDWLWKREKARTLGQVADLRNRATFPGFMDLPDENEVDLDFYESSDRVTLRPRRHWCFLGEIIDFATLVRLQMEIKDVDGRKIPIYFYTDGRGSELAPAKVQKGYTVAILYAQRHAFMFDKPGIRHEDPRMIKIFSLSLHQLLALNDQLQQFSFELDGIRTCHGCGRKATSLKRCGKCSSFWYCDRACQRAGWSEKGHKGNCNLLKDTDLRGLFALKWDVFDDHKPDFRLPISKTSPSSPANPNKYEQGNPHHTKSPTVVTSSINESAQAAFSKMEDNQETQIAKTREILRFNNLKELAATDRTDVLLNLCHLPNRDRNDIYYDIYYLMLRGSSYKPFGGNDKDVTTALGKFDKSIRGMEDALLVRPPRTDIITWLGWIGLGWEICTWARQHHGRDRLRRFIGLAARAIENGNDEEFEHENMIALYLKAVQIDLFWVVQE